MLGAWVFIGAGFGAGVAAWVGVVAGCIGVGIVVGVVGAAAGVAGRLIGGMRSFFVVPAARWAAWADGVACVAGADGVMCCPVCAAPAAHPAARRPAADIPARVTVSLVGRIATTFRFGSATCRLDLNYRARRRSRRGSKTQRICLD